MKLKWNFQSGGKLRGGGVEFGKANLKVLLGSDFYPFNLKLHQIEWAIPENIHTLPRVE